MQAFHLELRTADLKRSEAFYRRVFDVPPRAGCEAGYLLFEIGGAELLWLPGPVAAPVRFGFRLAKSEELEHTALRLAEQGLCFERRTFDHPALGVRELTLRLQDPDGHRCSFYWLAPP